MFPVHAATVDGEFSRCGPGRRRRTVGDMTNHTASIDDDPKVQAVQRLYAAYGRGDIDAVLAELADDVDWAAEASGTTAPWWGRFHGKAEVPRFFKEIGANIEVG